MLTSFFHGEEAPGGGPWPARPPARRRRGRGQALVELALTLFILLLVVLGGTDLLQMALTHYQVNQAVRAGAHQAALIGGPDGQDGAWREGSVPPTGTVAETVRVYLEGGIVTRAADATVRVTCARTPCRRYDPVTVQVMYNGSVWAPFPGLLGDFVVDRRATRLAEQDGQ